MLRNLTGFRSFCVRRMTFVLLAWLLRLPFLPPVGAAPSGAQARLFLTRPLTPQEIASRDTHGKYEPAVGCYLGAFIDFDPSLQRPVVLPLTSLKGHPGPARSQSAHVQPSGSCRV